MSDETQFGRLFAEIEKLTSSMDGMRGEITGMRGELMARLDRFGDQLSAIRDDISVNFGTADHVRRANDNTRDELRALVDQVTGMMRQIQRLQTEVRDLKGE